MAEEKAGGRILRVLIVDASADDAEQIIGALRRSGHMFKTQRVDKPQAAELALDDANYDCILCETGVAGLTPETLLGLIRRRGLHTPVIVVTRKIGDEDVRKLMTSGVHDVIVKDQWARLVPAIDREQRVAAERASSAEAATALRQLEERYRVMIEGSREAVCYCHEGIFVDANPAYLTLFGFESLDELKITPVLNLIDKRDQARFKACLRKPASAAKPQEFLAAAHGGSTLPVEIAMSSITIGGEPCVQIVVTDVSKRKAMETKLQQLHQHDALTGLYNRHYFLQQLGQLVESPRTASTPGTLLGIEVHDLKKINAALGHAACDRMLIMLARQLRDLVGDRALLARVGGGQFAILRTDGDAARTLRSAVDTMLGSLHFSEHGKSVALGLSVEELVLDAAATDRQVALDTVFPPRVAETVAADAAPAPLAVERTATAPAPAAPIDWRPAIEAALANDGFELLFQPIINLHGEPRQLYEAQLFLRTDGGELIAAVEFMPSAHDAGLAGRIDRWVAQHVIEQLSRHRRQGGQRAVLVSLSSAATGDDKLLSAILQHLKATRLPAESLYLQLDASLVAALGDGARLFANQAKTAGLGIVLDDFDAALSEVPRLTGFEVDFAKINCGLQSTAQGTAADAVTLQAAVDAAKSLATMTIAKNTGDAELFSLLWSSGVDYVQGDYLAPAGTELDYTFEGEQTLASDEPLAPNWRAAG